MPTSNQQLIARHWPRLSFGFGHSLVIVSLVLGPFFVAGCKLGPNYRRPTVETPSDWRWKTAEPKDQVPRGPWWTVFQDPVLDGLETNAIAGNLDLQAAFARVEQARATARINRAEFYPTLEASGTFTRYRTSGHQPSPIPQFAIPSFHQQQWSVPFDLTYELDLWGRVRRSFESAQQLALSAAAARQSILLSLQADVAASYFSWKSVTKEIDLLAQAIRLRQEAMDIFDQRLKAGVGNEFEVQRGRVEIASAQADLQAAERRRAEYLNSLALLSGKPPSNFKAEPPGLTVKIPEIAPDLPSALLERRPDVAQAERELASRLAQIGVAQAAFFPSVKLTTSAGFLSGEISDLFAWESRAWSLSPRINIPIFEGGRNKATLEKTRAAYEEGIALYRQKVLVAFKEVEDNLAALQYLQQEAQARRLAAEAATQSARLSLERYRAGAINFLDVIDSENVRLQNELAHLRITNDRLLATVRLIKALGGGWTDAK